VLVASTLDEAAAQQLLAEDVAIAAVTTTG
jgi:hypothetical protein